MPISHRIRGWSEDIGSRSIRARALAVTFSLTSPAPSAPDYRGSKLPQPGGSSDRKCSAGRTEKTAYTAAWRWGRAEEYDRPKHPPPWPDDPRGILAR